MQRWYLVHTKPLGEAVAQANLLRQGYEIYLPRLSESVRRGRLARERIVPLFPRYLFLRLIEGSQALRPVHSSVGVATVVRFGFSYAVVADKVIGDLKAREDPESGLHRLACASPFTAGVPVRVTTGPFDGLEGIFERAVGSDRVIVLLNILGQDARVRVAANCVVTSHAA